jgi:hypothetical protein
VATGSIFKFVQYTRLSPSLSLSLARARAKRNEKGGKIYARACMYAPGVIKGVNDGRGKSHNPLLFADLSVFRDALSGALSSAGAT